MFQLLRSDIQTGYRSGKPFQQWLSNPQFNQNHTVESMSQDGPPQQQHVPPAVAAKINALYEADHPKFQSRMDGKAHPMSHTLFYYKSYIAITAVRMLQAWLPAAVVTALRLRSTLT